MLITYMHTLQELSKLSGVSIRTIRYYIHIGLLPAPVAQGPHTRYPQETLDQLAKIGEMKEAGKSLSEIHEELWGADMFDRGPWTTHTISPGIKIRSLSNLPPDEEKILRKLLAYILRKLLAYSREA